MNGKAREWEGHDFSRADSDSQFALRRLRWASCYQTDRRRPAAHLGG